jgi:hypothetical protein
VVDCPTRNAKEVVDKKIIVDMMCFAWERIARNQRTCVVLISSDGDFAYMLNRLRDQHVHVGVIHGANVAEMLLQSADWRMNWRNDVLDLPHPSRSSESGHGHRATESAADRLLQLQLSGVPVLQRSFSREAATSGDGKFMTLLVALVDAQKKAASKSGEVGVEGGSVDWHRCWATEAQVCDEYYRKDGLMSCDKTERKARYHAARQSSVAAGFVESTLKHGHHVNLRITERGLGPASGQYAPADLVERATATASTASPSALTAVVPSWILGQKVRAKYTAQSNKWKRAVVVSANTTSVSVCFNGYPDMIQLPHDRVRPEFRAEPPPQLASTHTPLRDRVLSEQAEEQAPAEVGHSRVDLMSHLMSHMLEPTNEPALETALEADGSDESPTTPNPMEQPLNTLLPTRMQQDELNVLETRSLLAELDHFWGEKASSSSLIGTPEGVAKEEDWAQDIASGQQYAEDEDYEYLSSEEDL